MTRGWEGMGGIGFLLSESDFRRNSARKALIKKAAWWISVYTSEISAEKVFEYGNFGVENGGHFVLALGVLRKRVFFNRVSKWGCYLIRLATAHKAETGRNMREIGP